MDPVISLRFSLIFILKLDEPFRNEEICIISLSFKSSDLGFRINVFFLQFLVDFLPLGSGSVDPHIFVDPEPGSQNLADPTDPDPKHWYNHNKSSPKIKFFTS